MADGVARTRHPYRARGLRPAGRRSDVSLLADDPLWYKDAVIYELHVKSFADSDGDGVGDFPGLTSRLDYLQELGVTALWILPFYPSPLKDDGYDIADYRSVNPAYGTMGDFREFLREAHRRGIRVITELVINHTSDQHPWFQRARRAPRGSPERDYYVWSDDPDKYAEARIIFQDYEPSNWTWDPVAEQYFWHRFFHHQPDLNFDNPEVHDVLFDVMDFWLEMGVDGMRLDAIPYLYERDGTNCENLPETHAFLKKLRAHVDEKFENRMLLAEANQWPEDAARYFGDGDECHMNFHFPIMPRLFMALRMEDRFPIADILEQTPAIPGAAQWAVFLRNHDELTLEMVTDEERDYMYRVYAHEQTARINLGIRRRLAPLLENNRRKIELMNSLLVALPGTPVLYYGDEIGMGDNFYLGDRHGVRTPMQWSGDRNAGFSRANPQKLFLPVIIDPEYHYESVNVEAQHQNPSSLLWWMRRLIALRKQHPAFGRGTFRWVEHDNRRVLAFLREHGEGGERERILVVANLSRFSQALELDLSEFKGSVPLELFGRTAFPAVGEDRYRLTLGPHNFFWFVLRPRREMEAEASGGPASLPESLDDLPRLRTGETWDELFDEGYCGPLIQVLRGYVPPRRWFGGKARAIRSLTLDDLVPVPLGDEEAAYLAVLGLDYVAEDAERYLLPLAFTDVDEAGELLERMPSTLIARLTLSDGTEGVLYDAVAHPGFARRIVKMLVEGEETGGRTGRVVGVPGESVEGSAEALPVRVGTAEQSNTSIVLGDRWILKLLRRLEEGLNLDREIGRALTRQGFEHTPETAGALEYRWSPRRAGTVAVLQAFVPNQGDAWAQALDILQRYLEHAMASEKHPDVLPLPVQGLVAAAGEPLPELVHGVVEESTLEGARLLGRRTGEMHRALAGVSEPDFRAEPFTTLYQRSLYQSMRNLLGQTFRSLERGRGALEDEHRGRADAIVDRKADILGRFRSVLERKLEGERIRIHGDYHLGQVLWTGKDYVIIDFEGEPARPLSERRLKRSPLRDVAGMLRSYHYAAVTALFGEREQGVAAGAAHDALDGWARFWHRWVSVAFLQGYFEATGEASFLPRGVEARQLLLDVYLLEKALYELGYELGNRPVWARIPIEGILELLAEDGGAPAAAPA